MSHLIALVPSPLWVSKCMDSSIDGILAYGSYNKVVLIDFEKNIPSLRTIFQAHADRKRIIALSLSKIQNSFNLATICDDGSLKIFDVRSHPKYERSIIDLQNVCDVKWQEGSKSTVLFAHDNFILSKLDVQSGTLRKHRDKLKYHISVLATTSHDANLLGMGHANGVISLFDITGFKVLKQLDAHNAEIVSLQWSPLSSSQILSYTFKGKISIFKNVLDNPQQTTFTLQSKGPKKDYYHKENATVAIWHPNLENHVIFANDKGEILEVDLNSKESEPYGCREFSHSKMPSLLVGLKCSENLCCTYAIDRQLIFWDFSQRKSVFVLPTLGGEIYSLDISPIDFTKLAVACGDGYLRIWNQSPFSHQYDVDFYFQRRKNRITCLVWHPEYEGILALGMAEGTVGYIDTNSSKQNINFFTTRHSDTVYSLSWGPLPQSDEKNLQLYSCGSGKVLIHYVKNATKKALDFVQLTGKAQQSTEANSRLPASDFCTEVSWKPDFTVLAIGYKNGCIEIFDGNTATPLAYITFQRKPVQCLVWHPVHLVNSDEASQYHYWLACGSAEYDINVYDLSELSERPSTSTLTINQPAKSLKGHGNRIVSVIWNPHKNAELASASYDRSIMIWDVDNETPTKVFNGNYQRCFSLAWSYLDPDIVFGGWEDSCLTKFKISEQKDFTPIASEEDAQEKDRQNSGYRRKRMSYRSARRISSDSQASGTKEANIENQIVQSEPQEKKPKAELREAFRNMNLFSQFTEKNISGAQFDREYREMVESHKSNQSLVQDSSKLNLGLFGSKTDFFKSFEIEREKARKADKFDASFFCHMLRGSLREGLEEAAENGRLSHLHVAMAPAASKELWKETSEKFATQLSHHHRFRSAATYLFSIGKPEEALQMMQQNVGPRDTYAVARAILPNDDPKVRDLLLNWRDKSSTPFVAANCSLALNDPKRAAQIISRKNTATTEKVASYICLKYGELDLAKKYAIQSFRLSLLSRDYEITEELIKEQSSIAGFKIALVIQKELIRIMENRDIVFGLDGSKLLEQIQEDCSVFKHGQIRDRPFIVNLIEMLNVETKEFLTQSEMLESALEDFKLHISELGFGATESEVLYLVALNMAAYILSAVKSASENRADCSEFIFLNNALYSLCQKTEYTVLLNVACSYFLPIDLVWSYKDKALKLTSAIPETPSCQAADAVSKSFERLLRHVDVSETQNVSSCLDVMRLDVLDAVVSRVTMTDCVVAFIAANFFRQLRLELEKKELLLNLVEDKNPACLLWSCDNNSATDDEHKTCFDASELLFRMMDFVQTYVCRDGLAVRTLVQNKKHAVEEALLFVSSKSNSDSKALKSQAVESIVEEELKKESESVIEKKDEQTVTAVKEKDEVTKTVPEQKDEETVTAIEKKDEETFTEQRDEEYVTAIEKKDEETVYEQKDTETVDEKKDTETDTIIEKDEETVTAIEKDEETVTAIEKEDNLTGTIIEKEDNLTGTIIEKEDALTDAVIEKEDALTDAIIEKEDALTGTIIENEGALTDAVIEKEDALTDAVIEKKDEDTETVTAIGKEDELMDTIIEKKDEETVTAIEKKDEETVTAIEKKDEEPKTVTEKKDEDTKIVTEEKDEETVTKNIDEETVTVIENEDALTDTVIGKKDEDTATVTAIEKKDEESVTKKIDKETEIRANELSKERHLLMNLLQLIDEKHPVKRNLNCHAAASEIIDFCQWFETVIKCPALSEKLQKFSYEVNTWLAKVTDCSN